MKSRLDEIRERLEKATPGPWEQNQGVYVCTADERETPHGKMKIEITGAYGKTDERFASRLSKQESADHDLIANAPSDLKFLLDEITRLTNELETIKDGSPKPRKGDWE